MTPILTTSSTVLCPHGGRAQLATTNTDVLIDGTLALLQTDLHPIVGCTFTPPAIGPCVSIRWLSGSTQTRAAGVPVLLQTSVGLCLNAAQVPLGTALVVQVQAGVNGS